MPLTSISDSLLDFGRSRRASRLGRGGLAIAAGLAGSIDSTIHSGGPGRSCTSWSLSSRRRRGSMSCLLRLAGAGLALPSARPGHLRSQALPRSSRCHLLGR